MLANVNQNRILNILNFIWTGSLKFRSEVGFRYLKPLLYIKHNTARPPSLFFASKINLASKCCIEARNWSFNWFSFMHRLPVIYRKLGNVKGTPSFFYRFLWIAMTDLQEMYVKLYQGATFSGSVNRPLWSKTWEDVKRLKYSDFFHTEGCPVLNVYNSHGRFSSLTMMIIMINKYFS